MEKKKVRIGLIGLGGIGAGTHAKYLPTIEKGTVAAVCDLVKEKADALAARFGAEAYYDAESLLDGAKPDMVIIATPHYDHTVIAIQAFERGVSVLSEKPIGVHVNDAQRMIDAHEAARRKHPELEFGVMLQQRLLPENQKLKDILDSGELGRLVRVTRIHTQWYRTQFYYDSGGWRATWAGEGGGVLTNQCPHTLDQYQWLFGMPSAVTAVANIAKYHDIEVEDEVMAMFEHDNGMVGQFITSTAETPGVDRIEIAGEYGLVILEEGKLSFMRNRSSMFEFTRTATTAMKRPECWPTQIPVRTDLPTGHGVVTQRFVDRLAGDKSVALVAEGREGLNSVMLANAMMLSSDLRARVELPMNGDAWEARLKQHIAEAASKGGNTL